FPGLGSLRADHVPNTLYQLYHERFGVIIHRAVEKISADAAGPDTGRTVGTTGIGITWHLGIGFGGSVCL
ncbi:MAG: hypothetical protein VW709_12170, partial [Rickettsiales bacterium]